MTREQSYTKHVHVHCSCASVSIEERERNGPTIPIINISRGFSELHSSKEGTCTALVHFIVHAPSVHSSRSPTYTASISLLVQKYFSFSSASEHMRVDFLPSSPFFFSPSLRRLPLFQNDRSAASIVSKVYFHSFPHFYIINFLRMRIENPNDARY